MQLSEGDVLSQVQQTIRQSEVPPQESVEKARHTANHGRMNTPFAHRYRVKRFKDDTLRYVVRINNALQTPISSLEASLAFSSQELKLADVRLNQTVWPTAVMKWHTLSGKKKDTLQIAITNSRKVIEGEIVEVVFYKKKSLLQDSIQIISALLDKLPTRLKLRRNNIMIGGEYYPADQPFQFELKQNTPNPFTSLTVISYTLPRSEIVTIKVYNIVGKLIATLIEGERQAEGQHHVRFDGSALSSGMYLYRLEAGDFVSTKKMMLVK